MGKYKSSAVKREKPVVKGPHSIWRGFGCLTMIILPVISYAAAVETVAYGQGHGWAFPYQLMGMPRFPPVLYRVDVVAAILRPITTVENLYAYLMIGLLYMILLSGVISVIYAFVYRMVAPSRWGPLDVPPPKIKTKKYTR